MEIKEKTIISVQAKINAPIGKVWKYWTTPEDIIKWNSASPDWHTPKAVNDLTPGGIFNYRMEAKDGSMGFDFSGVYNTVEINNKIGYTLDDGRRVLIVFNVIDKLTLVTESFEAEDVNPFEMQRAGWQAILDNFKNHVENEN